MTTTSWTESAQQLMDEANGWSGVRTLTHSVALALQRLAVLEGWDEDLSLTYAGLDVALAVSELTWVDPMGMTDGVPSDLGTLAPPDRPAAIGVVLQLLARDIDLLSARVTDPAASTSEVVAGNKVLGFLIGAERCLRGARS